MNILHVIPSIAPAFGGPTRAVQEMCRALAERGHKVCIVSGNADVNGTYISKSLSKTCCREPFSLRLFPQHFWYYGFSLPMALGLLKLIPAHDIVHIHSLYVWSTAVASLICRRLNKPYILRPHGTLDPFMRNRNPLRKKLYLELVERRNLNGAAAIHYTALEEAELVKDLGLTAPALVIPLGIKTDEFLSSGPSDLFSRTFPAIHDKSFILFFSRLHPKKGLDILVKGFGRIASQFPELQLVISGPDENGFGHQVKAWVRECGLEERTHFTGMLQGELKAAALKEAKIFALPSYTENFGLAVVEALASGTPAIISDKVNIWRELFNAGAVDVTSCNVEEFGQKLQNLLRSPARQEEMRLAGPRIVREKYSWPGVARQLEDAYHAILKGLPIA